MKMSINIRFIKIILKFIELYYIYWKNGLGSQHDVNANKVA